MSYSQHPLSSAFPAMSPDEFAALVADIREHGQRDVATIYDGMVLDGWHRYRACCELGIPCRFEDFAGIDPTAFVISRNRHRRHLTETQRAVAVVAVHRWRSADVAGEPTNRGTGDSSHPSATVKQMASEAGVDERTIQRTKKGYDAGLGDAMRDNKVNATVAAEIAASPDVAKAVASGSVTASDAVKEVRRKRQPDPPPVVEQYDEEDDGAPSAEEIAAFEAQDRAEREFIEKLIAADDKLKAASDEVRRLNAIIVQQDGRIRGLINEVNAAKTAAKNAMRRAERAEREAAKAAQ